MSCCKAFDSVIGKHGLSWLAACLLTVAGDLGVQAAAPALEPGKLESLELTDFRGREFKLQDLSGDSIIVVAFLGTECPLAKHYANRLNSIAKDYEESVQVLAVMSNRQDSLEDLEAFALRHKLTYPVLKDPSNLFADQVGAKRTPEVFVYDQKRHLRYRGRVDDQWGVTHQLDKPRRRDLRLALNDLLEGREVAVARTEASGCIISRTKKVDVSSEVTYGSHIARILRKNCTGCHRDGEIAPFALTDGEDAASWADMIAEVVREQRMPPWHATDEYEKLSNERRLSEEEKTLIQKWADAGGPLGVDPKLPPLPEKPEHWQLPREPDLVLPVTYVPESIRATGTERYRFFMQDPGFTEDKWVTAAELRPGNREVVHHILAFAVPPGQERRVLSEAVRNYLFGFVPGSRVEPFPPGYAKKIPAGSRIWFQVHYTPNGTPQKDQSHFGLVFADPAKVTHEIKTDSAWTRNLRIPPEENAYKTSGTSLRLPPEATLLAFSPHMHVRGKAFDYDLITPGGGSRMLLNVPDYDFNWQTTYVLENPIPVPEGSRIRSHAVYDNSQDNLSNPDPTKWVRWGDQTWDEMMIGFFHYSVPRTPVDRSDEE